MSSPGAAAVGLLAAHRCVVCAGRGGEREVGSISCNGQAISAENIYNFLSI